MDIASTGFDYDELEGEYAGARRTDPHIADRLREFLGDAQSLLNVGAGTGSYEPQDLRVVAVEPSKQMRAQRPAHVVPALAHFAEDLPFAANAFEASMAILSVHHWPDLQRGLAEMRRVTSGPVVVMTFDPNAPTDFWLKDYVPEMHAVEMRRYGPIDRIVQGLGGADVHTVPVTRACQDAFQAALYARPEWFLRAEVRAAQSAWSHLPAGVEARAMADLANDLRSGAWDERYGHLRTAPTVMCQLRMVVSQG